MGDIDVSDLLDPENNLPAEEEAIALEKAIIDGETEEQDKPIRPILHNIPIQTLLREGQEIIVIISSISFYVLINIGMTIGFFPITGLPLPLLSYGGSSLITNFFALGLLLNIEMRRTAH